MDVYETAAALGQARAEARGRVVLVPTMGALHEGHLSLIRRGRALGDWLVVSIFVNPAQFGPGEDYEHYPRTLEADLARCEAAGVDAVLAPSVAEVYPPTMPDAWVDVPGLTGDLEGAHRPGHFAGVCRVVAKLFGMVQPDAAVFGQKDYQQLKVLEAMTADLAMPVQIEAGPTVREPDGLAISSRNQYLSGADREHALGLYKALWQARQMVEEAGETDPATVEEAMARMIRAHHLTLDYAVVRHPQTLGELDIVEPAVTGGVVALVAGRLGQVRLIDNMVMGR